jgi:hypothetical protein
MGLLDDIEISESSESSYMKFEKGENRFRMVSKPTLGYIYWEDKTPTRVAKASEAADGSEPKLFWSMIVWNNDRVRILEITQSTVHKALKSLEDNSDWGNLTEYDVIVNKNGEGMETSYNVVPCPKTPLTKEAIATIKDFNKNYDPKKIFETVEQSDADSLPF